MADEQDPKTEPEEKPEGKEPEVEPGGDGGDGEPIKDGHGQVGISKAKYERERREWEAKVADLQAKLDTKTVFVDYDGGVEISDAVPIKSRTGEVTSEHVKALPRSSYLRPSWKRSSTSWYSARFLRKATVKTTVRTAKIAR